MVCIFSNHTRLITSCASNADMPRLEVYRDTGALKDGSETVSIAAEPDDGVGLRIRKRELAQLNLQIAAGDNKSPECPPTAYCRIVPAEKSTSLIPSDLKALGEAITGGEANLAHSHQDGIPAAYTYLGQFIAHDLTNMNRTDDGEYENWSSAILDIGTVLNGFSSGSNSGVLGYFVGEAGVGPTMELGSFDDLPRYCDGRPYIADQRNDHNLALAQIHVLISKFCQLVSTKTVNWEEAKIVARRHIQWLILHDYLKRIIDFEVYSDVKNTKRCVLLKSDRTCMIPIEFAAACFRMGHSMVRPAYNWNEHHRSTLPYNLLHQTFFGGGFAEFPEAPQRLRSDWVIDWSRFCGGSGADSNMASPIGPELGEAFRSINADLSHEPLDPSVDGKINLAVQTLLRGYTLEIPSAQKVYDFVDSRLDEAGAPCLSGLLSRDEIASCASGPLKVFLKSEAGDRVANEMPLWFYTLLESRLQHGGRRLGSLGSRIVMETIFRSIQADAEGIFACDFEPDEEYISSDGKFDFLALVNIVHTKWKSPRII